MMQPSDSILNYIRGFESCVLHPYLDSGDIPTIGWGCTSYQDGSKVTLHDASISQGDADDLFKYHISKVTEWINRITSCPLNQNQFDACLSFFYNVGYLIFASENPHTFKYFINCNWVGFANNMKLFIHDAKGNELAGLIKRREFEYELFNS